MTKNLSSKKVKEMGTEICDFVGRLRYKYGGDNNSNHEFIVHCLMAHCILSATHVYGNEAGRDWVVNSINETLEIIQAPK